MPDYDFQILQPNEFECLTRDLLQKKERVFVESFTPGRDGGIDLRFAKIKGKNSIVQCKRYKDFNELYGQLKKEIKKVKILSPSRYILSTSVGLTPDNKEKIMALFEGFIKKTEDIWGKSELNNLLGVYPEIEKHYYKLWLGSTTVLESIINKKIENWSGFEIEEIRREVATYVMNDSFNEALQILNDNRYVIISGIPGIGKTTLARMLAYHILGKGYEEFIKVTTMDDAAQKYTEGRKQLFYFDDFLGANFFNVNEVGFEDKIISFIQKVKRTPDKLFILSTREYILSTARRQYEKFGLKNIEIAKCTIELSKYSEDIRARILYNHLADSVLPKPYIEAILDDNQYLKIIKHQNFNPRIIEAFLGKNLYKQTNPDEFVKHFWDFFDRPYSVWEFAFRKMPPLAQHALFILLSLGGCSYLNNWRVALDTFLRGTRGVLQLDYSEEDWREMLDLLQGTFVLLGNSPHGIVVKFHNPSVFDFLLDYLRGLPLVQRLIINNTSFSDQLINLFTDREVIYGESGKIRVPLEWESDIITTIKRGLTNLTAGKLDVGDGYYTHVRTNIAKYLISVQNNFPVIIRNNPGLLESVVMPEHIYNKGIDIEDRIELLCIVDEKQCKIDIKTMIPSLIKDINWSYELVKFLSMLDDKQLLSEITDNNSFFELANEIIEDEIFNLSSEDEGANLKDDISGICCLVPTLDASYWFDAIDAKVAKDPPEELDYDEDWATESYYRARAPEDNSYSEMFSSLLGQ